MFYESNELMSHESLSQQVGSAVFHKDRTRGQYLEAPGNYRGLAKLFCFPFQMGFSKVLNILQ